MAMDYKETSSVFCRFNSSGSIEMDRFPRMVVGLSMDFFFTYTLPHAELVQPNDSILKQYKEKFFHDKTWGDLRGVADTILQCIHMQEFAGMITRLDAYVGEILAKLKEKVWIKNTIVIFSSDNGPHEEGRS